MHRYSTAIAAAIATALLAGCAGAETQSADSTPRAEKVYRTGSNLPVRDNDGTVVTVKPDSAYPIMNVPTAPIRGGM